jgi:hypothetical protein
MTVTMVDFKLMYLVKVGIETNDDVDKENKIDVYKI